MIMYTQTHTPTNTWYILHKCCVVNALLSTTYVVKKGFSAVQKFARTLFLTEPLHICTFIYVYTFKYK